MKRSSKFTAILFFLFLFSAGLTSAHQGGHFHKGDGTIFSQWHLKNGTIISGNYHTGNSRFIELEQEEGKLLKIELESLKDPDKQTATARIDQFKTFNDPVHIYPDYTIPQHRTNYRFLWISIALFILTLLIAKESLVILKRFRNGLTKWVFATCSFSILLVLGFACKKSRESVVETIPSTIPKTSTTFIDSAFAPFKATLTTSSDNTYYYVSSNGVPTHGMMVGITSWQQQVPIPQSYTGTNSWSIPLQPVYAETPLPTTTNLMKGAVAIAVNGIPIFNALNNRGVDSYLIGELDTWGGHCGRADDYHYHAAPLHLSSTSGELPIAFALDGFPVYGSKEPDGSIMKELDVCHGHVISNGVYHYHGTTNYPYVVGSMKGKVTLDPTTTAPENQIIPQAFASPLRPATTPLSGAVITAFASTGTNAYKLTYQIGSKFGYVEYNWDASNKYTYKLTDVSGAVSTTTYQRK